MWRGLKMKQSEYFPLKTCCCKIDKVRFLFSESKLNSVLLIIFLYKFFRRYVRLSHVD